ncbi:right-handed parallel beta-helix repeat-containing protein, partial [candidate division WOR-3 bacterium]|nr:right-handed parallel beta-helix repeat-containing protein [candidate division WOR-3 bacterium]
MMKKAIGILLALYLLTFLFGGGGDQEDWPNIYIDESVAPGGVGSEADPYSDFSEINWSAGGDNSIADWYAGAEDASVTISNQRGETWRETLSVGGPGSAAYPIVIGAYGAGALPIINAADLYTPWNDEGGNVWWATCAVEPEDVYMDEEFGDEKALKVNLVNLLDWWWDDPNDRLYIYATEDPDTLYPTAGVEGSQRSSVISVGTTDHYIDIENLYLKFGKVRNLYIAGNNCNVTNVTCKKGGNGIDIVGAETFLIDTCIIDGNHATHHHGISVSGAAANWSDGGIIRDTEVFDVGSVGDLLQGIAIFKGSRNIVLLRDTVVDGSENNFLVYSNDAGLPISNVLIAQCISSGAGTNGYGVDTHVSDVILERNFSFDNTVSGIQTSNGTSDITARYNICYDNGTYGISIAGTGNNHKVYNNTISALAGAVNTGLRFSGLAVGNGNEAKNNIVYGLFTFELFVGAGSNPILDNNCYFATNAAYQFDWQGVVDVNFANYQVTSGEDANGINVDPLFVNSAGNDFRLLMASLLINAGTDVGLTTDYRGRSIRHAPDIGAYEDPTNAIFMMTRFFN